MRSTRPTRQFPAPHSPAAQTRPAKRRKLAVEQSCWLFKLPDDLWTIVRDLTGAEEAVGFALACRDSLALVQGPNFWESYEQPMFKFSHGKHKGVLRFFISSCIKVGRPLQRLMIEQPYYQDRERWSDYQGYSLNKVTVETLIMEGKRYSDRLGQETKALNEFGCIHNLVARGTSNICLSLRDSHNTRDLLSLVISSQSLHDGDLQTLQKLQQLENLALHQCDQITDRGLTQSMLDAETQETLCINLRQNYRLRPAELQITGLTLRKLPTSVLQQLPSLTKLQELDLLDLRPLSPPEIRALNKNLTQLRLAPDREFSDELLDEIVGLRGLQALCLSECKGITLQGLAKLQRCPALQELRLGQANLLADLSELHAFRSLRTLKLWRCGISISANIFSSLPTGLAGCKSLQRIVLRSYLITNSILSELKQCHRLQELEFNWCCFNEDTAELRHCQALRKVTFSEYGIPPEEMLHQLKQARPGLQVDTYDSPANELEDPWDS